ncbi:MAG: BatD family protein, partial [Desulfobulbales bacterium]
METGPQNTKDEKGFSHNYSVGSVVLHQHLNRKEITVADQIELTLEATTPENVKIEFPTYSASLGDFTLKDTRNLPDEMTGSEGNLRVMHRIIYVLEPYLPGTYTIPVMEITYSESDPVSEVSKLETEKIEVQVKSLLPPGADQVAIKDIKPPLLLPPNRVRLALLIGLILFVSALAVCIFYFWNKRKRKKVSPETALSPEEIARQELDRLLAENLLTKGEIKFFHLRISDILRRYIENRFGLKAPERTTEEFLVELSRADSATDALLRDHKTLLTDFLTQCDLVKFAKHEPSINECEKTV